MLNFLYDAFVALYNDIRSQNPTLASEHALRQEQEIYERTTKSTYPNVIFFCLVLAASSSLTFSDRQDLYCLSQATRAPDSSHRRFSRYRGGSRPTQGICRFSHCATLPIPTTPFTSHPRGTAAMELHCRHSSRMGSWWGVSKCRWQALQLRALQDTIHCAPTQLRAHYCPCLRFPLGKTPISANRRWIPFNLAVLSVQHQCLQANVRGATHAVGPQPMLTPMAAHGDHTSFTRVIPLNFTRVIHSPRVRL